MAQAGPLCPMKPCHPAVPVHPCHSHAYTCSFCWYVCMGSEVQSSCVHCHPSDMLYMNILTCPVCWSGGQGFSLAVPLSLLWGSGAAPGQPSSSSARSGHQQRVKAGLRGWLLSQGLHAYSGTILLWGQCWEVESGLAVAGIAPFIQPALPWHNLLAPRTSCPLPSRR